MKNVELSYSLEIKEKEDIVWGSGIRPAHSFTKQFAQFLFNYFFSLGSANISSMTDTDGASQTSLLRVDQFDTDAGTTTDTYGIQVGSGTGAESISDNALDTQISHGTSVGELQYGGTTFAAPSTTATTTTFRVSRVFTNGSGGSVTVQEIGLVYADTVGIDNFFLIIRDLTGSVSVGDGQQLTVNYDFTTTI